MFGRITKKQYMALEGMEYRTKIGVEGAYSHSAARVSSALNIAFDSPGDPGGNLAQYILKHSTVDGWMDKDEYVIGKFKALVEISEKGMAAADSINEALVSVARAGLADAEDYKFGSSQDSLVGGNVKWDDCFETHSVQFDQMSEGLSSLEESQKEYHRAMAELSRNWTNAVRALVRQYIKSILDVAFFKSEKRRLKWRTWRKILKGLDEEHGKYAFGKESGGFLDDKGPPKPEYRAQELVKNLTEWRKKEAEQAESLRTATRRLREASASASDAIEHIMEGGLEGADTASASEKETANALLHRVLSERAPEGAGPDAQESSPGVQAFSIDPHPV